MQITDVKNFDLKNWWTQHKKCFPALFKLFLRISSNPATSCSSERAFSGASNTVTAKRSCLLPDNVNALALMRNYYKKQ